MRVFFFLYFIVYEFHLKPDKFSNKMCDGLMHITESLNPDKSVPGDSIEHFADGIQKLIDLTVNLGNKITSYNSEQVMRLVLASYDAGFVTVLKDLGKLKFKISLTKFTCNFSQCRQVHNK